MRDGQGETLLEEHPELPDHEAALKILLGCLGKRFPDQRLDAVGHRVVHGGVKYCQPCLITPEVLIGLDEIVRLAPEHLPHELKAIRAVQQHYPGLPQVACFDTAFHRHMPELAQAIPWSAAFGTKGCGVTVFTVFPTSTSWRISAGWPARRRPTPG